MGKPAQVLERERIAARAAAEIEPAWLRAQAAVAAAPAEHARERAAAGHAHAQRAVDEHLHLQRRGRGDGGDLLHGQLAREHHARKTHPLECRCARSVVHGHLRGGVQRQRRTYPPHQRRRAHVLHDRRVHARRRDGAHRIRKRIELRVEHERVERDMHAHIARVAVGHGAPERVRIEIGRVAARAEGGQAEIHRVRAGADGGGQLLLAAGGRQDLKRFSGFPFHAPPPCGADRRRVPARPCGRVFS